MNKEIKMKIGTKIIKLINGTPHNLKFEDGSLLEGNIELAKIITASPSELKIDEFRVRTTFIPNPKALDYLNHLDNDTYVITSIIGLEINHPKLISPITTPETTRLPPDQKICFKTKWNAKGNENDSLIIPFLVCLANIVLWNFNTWSYLIYIQLFFNLFTMLVKYQSEFFLDYYLSCDSLGIKKLNIEFSKKEKWEVEIKLFSWDWESKEILSLIEYYITFYWFIRTSFPYLDQRNLYSFSHSGKYYILYYPKSKLNLPYELAGTGIKLPKPFTALGRKFQIIVIHTLARNFLISKPEKGEKEL